jgi:hypothetical protein
MLWCFVSSGLPSLSFYRGAAMTLISGARGCLETMRRRWQPGCTAYGQVPADVCSLP